jgi:hypothetical protein
VRAAIPAFAPPWIPIEIFRHEGEHISTVRVTKQRDLERGEPMPFSLTVVELGEDRRGKPVTSCVVKHEDEMLASKPKSGGRKSNYSADALLGYLPAANATEWAKRAKEDRGIGNSQQNSRAGAPIGPNSEAGNWSGYELR